MRSFSRYYLPVLLWMAVVTLLSTSDFIASPPYRWARATARFFLGEVSPATWLLLKTIGRKLVHVAEFFVLTVLVWRVARGGATESWRWRSALGTLAAGLVFAVLDEWHRLFEPGRHWSLLNVGFDTSGILLALLLIYLRAHQTPAASLDSARDEGAAGLDKSKP